MNALPIGLAPNSIKSIGILSTFPPTPCGLATFSSSLLRGLESIGVDEVNVVRVVDKDDDVKIWDLDRHVISEWQLGSEKSQFQTTNVLNSHDAVFMQHEFGIFDGVDGDNVLKVLTKVHAPIVTTLHTVPLHPTVHQREVLESVIDLSHTAVVMTAMAHQRLVANYDVDPLKIMTIPHGATLPAFTNDPPITVPQLLTWGLIGPGKGIEHAIRAIALLHNEHPDIHYLVAGRTHPKVLAHEGEKYRESLVALAHELGVDDHVTFDDSYRTLDELLELLAHTTCVVLPYDSIDQITSGVLVDAIAAGRPVVATRFPHAVELLATGAGMLCPHKDSRALAHAIHEVISSPLKLRQMHLVSTELAQEHSWNSVAARYFNIVNHPLSLAASAYSL
jgi:glycosyltransferase involved in cell wall biosynthesis